MGWRRRVVGLEEVGDEVAVVLSRSDLVDLPLE
jgi:hypothetical protein